MTTFLIPILLASWLGGQAPTAEVPRPPAGEAAKATSPAEIAAAVERLGADRFAEREEATELLWKAGRVALPALEAAAKDHDLERATRAKGLLEKVRWGIWADTPPEVVALISQYRVGSATYKQLALRKLRDLQRFDVIVDLLQADSKSPNSDQLVREFSREIRAAAIDAMASGDPSKAQALLQWTMRLDRTDQGLRDYAAYLFLTGKQEEATARLSREIKLTPDGESARLLAQLLLFQGKYAEARTALGSADDEPLKTELAYRLQDWVALARKYPLDEAAKLEQFAFALKFNRLVGNEAEADKALAGIRELAKNEADQVWMCVEALLLNEMWREAEELAATSPKLRMELLCDQMRYREALALIGPQGKPGWAAAWFADEAAQHESESPEATNHYYFALQAARALHLVGEKEEVDQLLAALAIEAPHAKYYARWRALMDMEMRLGRREQAERQAMDLLADDEAVAQIMYVYFKKQPTAARAWWKFLQIHFPQDDRTVTWKRLSQLMTPGDGSPFAEATLAELAATAELSGAKTQPQLRANDLQAIAEVCLLRNDAPRAIAYFEKQIQALDEIKNASTSDTYLLPAATALLKIGDARVAQKEWTKAVSAYEAAWQRGKTQALPLYLRGHALVQAGEVEAGRDLMRRAELLPLASATQRRLLAVGMQERGLASEARTQREQLWQLAARTTWDFDVLNTAETEGKQLGSPQIAKAEPYWSYLQICVLRTNTSMSETIGYRELAQAIHKSRAWAHMEASRWDEAIAELKLAQAVRPGYSAFVEQSVQKLDAAGRKADADAVFEQAYQIYADNCRDYPRSAWHHNGGAWLAAQCDRRLDDALRLAEQAVKLQPKTAAYLDTLAEVHFRRGNFEQAVEIEKKAVALAPDDEEIREQMKKFAAAAKKKS